VNDQSELKMARTIAAFLMFSAVALVSGLLTVNLLTFTAETMVRVAASTPIRTYSAKTGYVPSLRLAKADALDIARSVPVVPVSISPEMAPAVPTFVVATDSLRVRSGPSKTSPQLFGLSAGTPVTVGNTRNGWVLVTAGGRTGWVYGKFLRPAAVGASGGASAIPGLALSRDDDAPPPQRRGHRAGVR
jgi:uncharacterized protein YgiM (DUF1202 family)